MVNVLLQTKRKRREEERKRRTKQRIKRQKKKIIGSTHARDLDTMTKRDLHDA
jgi:hypothetical protein